MVLPAALITAIKQRAQDRGQSITAYISGLVRADLAESGESASSLPERLLQLETRLQRLEQRLNTAESNPV